MPSDGLSLSTKVSSASVAVFWKTAARSCSPRAFSFETMNSDWILASPCTCVICAWIVAFFPILSNTSLGLRSVDRNLADLYRIYGASRWQRLIHLQLPSALPYFLGGLRIAGGLSLIGAVVAEYVAGTAGIGTGLAFRILEAGYRLNIPRMFAALALIAALGVLIFAVLSLISHLALRHWHESALKRES